MLDFLYLYYELGRIATSPKLEGMTLCMDHLCRLYVPCYSGWLELWLSGAGGPRVLCTGDILVGWLELKWVQARAVLRVSGQTVIAECGASQGVLRLSTQKLS